MVEVIGTTEDDPLSGTAQADRIVGLEGNDTAYGLAGNDVFIWGNSFADFVSDDGSDTYDGGSGQDTYQIVDLFYDDGHGERFNLLNRAIIDLDQGVAMFFDGGSSPDELISIENVITGQSDDIVIGSDIANRISVGGGNNLVHGGGGSDIIIGGTSVNSSGVISPISERLNGGDGNDNIDSGGSFWRYFDPRSSDAAIVTDRLKGGAGDDLLIGRAGNTVMTGGSGADRFRAISDTFEFQHYLGYVEGIAAAAVVITDFTSADRIRIFTGFTHYDDNFVHLKGAIPEWQGMTADLDIDEAGYVRSGADTIIRYHFLYETPFSLVTEDGLSEEVDLTITLRDYTGPVRDDWIGFA